MNVYTHVISCLYHHITSTMGATFKMCSLLLEYVMLFFDNMRVSHLIKYKQFINFRIPHYCPQMHC